MMYTAIRLGFDIIYWAGRLTIDGAYYMIYGHQETKQENMEKQIHILEAKLEEKSILDRENHKILMKIADKYGIVNDKFEEEIEEDTILIN